MAVTNYLWDQDSYLEEYDELETTTAIYTNEPTQFGRVVSQLIDSKPRFYHYDVLGSTHQLSIESEIVTDTFSYDAWGNELTHTGTTKVPFR